MDPSAELGLDLVRSERAWRRLPHWDPRLWQQLDEGLECSPKRDARHLSTLGIDWAKRFLQRSQLATAPQPTATRPSHGRPQRSEDGRKGGGTARAGSAHSARRQATTLVAAQRLATADLPSTRARAEQAGGGHKDDDRRRVRSVQTFRGEPSLWQSPPQGYQPPPAPGGTTTFQLLLQDEDYSYDVVNNPTEIRDWRIPDEWPAGAKPATRKIQYDD